MRVTKLAISFFIHFPCNHGLGTHARRKITLGAKYSSCIDPEPVAMAAEDVEWYGDINVANSWKTYKFNAWMTIGSVLSSLSQRGVDTKGKALVDEGNTPVSV